MYTAVFPDPVMPCSRIVPGSVLVIFLSAIDWFLLSKKCVLESFF